MSIRSDISVNWNVSPRIIEISAPSTEIIIQDLVDTIRYVENDLNNIDDPHLLNASGKEDLGGGIRVGITAILQNAKLKFQSRAGPDYIQCNIRGGNLVAIDENGDSMNPIEPSSFTQVVLANSVSAAIIANDYAMIADTVLDEIVEDHQTSGSLGKVIQETEKKVDDTQALVVGM